MVTRYGHRPGIEADAFALGNQNRTPRPAEVIARLTQSGASDSCPHCGEPRTDGALCGDCANEVRSEADARADRMAWEIDTYDEREGVAQEDGR